MSHPEFLVQFAGAVNSEELGDALAMLIDPNNRCSVDESCLDFIEIIGCRFPREARRTENPHFLSDLAEMLDILAKNCRPSDVLVGVFDLLENKVGSVDEFATVCNVLRLCCVRLRAERRRLDEALTLLASFLAELDKPSVHLFNEEDEAMTFLDLDEAAQQMCRAIHAAVDFVRPFVSELACCKSANISQRTAFVMVKFMLDVVDRQLVYLDVSQSAKYESEVATCVKAVLSLLFDLAGSDVLRLTNLVITKGRFKALVLCAYFARSRSVLTERQVYVYDLEYEFECLIPLISRILADANTEAALLPKTLSLLNWLLKRLENGSWGAERLRSQHYQDTFLSLINVMQVCFVVDTRREALSTFAAAAEKFCDAGQLALVKMLFAELLNDANDRACLYTNRGNLLGWLIDFYRQKLAERLIFAGSGSSGKSVFELELPNLLPVVLHFDSMVEEEEQLLVMERYDQICAALNFVRFLRLNMPRLSPSTITAAVKSSIRERFLFPLAAAIEKSRRTCQFDIATCRKEVASTAAEEAKSKLRVLDNCSTSLDMLYSIFDCVNQLPD